LPNLGDTFKRRVAVMTRTKIDIIDDIHEKLANRYTKREVSDIVESVFDIIKETAQHEGRVMISGFGIFATRDKKARLGRNPKTGGRVEISPRRILTFKPSPVLNASVNRATREIEAEEVTQKEG
jgi:integration host factor subunit alpha